VTLATVPAYAQVYKWVDERGVTNYSSEPPADRKAGLKPATVADRISVYAPEPAVQRAISAISLGKDRILSDRIDSLERQLAADRQSSQYAAAAEAHAAQAAYAQCVAERRVDCDYDSGRYPYASGGVLTVIHRRPRPHIPAMARSGAGAGNFRATIRASGRSNHATPGVAAEDIARLHSDGKLRRAGIFRN
jgi:uncharacterized protein DUF4124